MNVVGDALLAFRARQLGKSEANIAFDGKPGKDAAFLENKDAARIGSVDRLAIDGDRSAGRGKEACHGANSARSTCRILRVRRDR